MPHDYFKMALQFLIKKIFLKLACFLLSSVPTVHPSSCQGLDRVTANSVCATSSSLPHCYQKASCLHQLSPNLLPQALCWLSSHCATFLQSFLQNRNLINIHKSPKESFSSRISHGSFMREYHSSLSWHSVLHHTFSALTQISSSPFNVASVGLVCDTLGIIHLSPSKP